MNQKISLRLYNKEKKDAIHLIKNFWNSVPLPFLTLPSTRTPPEPGRPGQPADAAHPLALRPHPARRSRRRPARCRCGGHLRTRMEILNGQKALRTGQAKCHTH